MVPPLTQHLLRVQRLISSATALVTPPRPAQPRTVVGTAMEACGALVQGPGRLHLSSAHRCKHLRASISWRPKAPNRRNHQPPGSVQLHCSHLLRLEPLGRCAGAMQAHGWKPAVHLPATG
jgi:hypothetical protein